jgi:hypothetical protein
MFTTQVYLYKQKHQVVLRDTTQALTSVRYNPVYAKKLKLHKGTDNVLVFTFVNQDQKPVNNSTATFTFRLINGEGSDLILAKTMDAIDATKGTASVTVTEQDLDALDTQTAHYTIERSLSTSALNDAVFVDDNLGGRGVVDIVDSIMPTHTQSTTVTIPSYYDGAGITTHYSSEWNGTNDVQTLQYKPSTFTGDIQVEGATADDNLWYNIGTEISLSASSSTGYITVSGYHPYLRLRIEETSGSISEIKIR